jgi:hypothetical protein
MHLNRLQFFAALLLILSLGFACDNDPDEIGVGIQPDSDRLNVFFTDTLTVNAYSEYVDSVRTDETSRTMIGSYYDPVFGVSTSSLTLELRLSSASVELGDSPVLDSMVMTLDYATVALSGDEVMAAYGDTLTQQTFRIFEVDETLDADTSYYSNYEVALKAGEIASHTFYPRPTDSVMVDTSKVEALLRIKMEDSFVQKFRDAEEGTLDSLQGFLNFLKGIHIQPDEVSTGGAILFFNVGSVYSRMTLYYSNAEEDSLEYYFPITSSSARFMNFSHNYELAAPEFINQLDGDTTLGQQVFYLQSLAGVSAIVEIPNFRAMNNLGDIALNEARLVIENSDKASMFQPPAELAIFTYYSDGSTALVIDQFEGSEYFGGLYDDNTGRIEFRITQQLQRVLSTDTIPPRFYLGVSGASILPNRMVCNGSGQNPGGLKLELIYSQLSDQ